MDVIEASNYDTWTAWINDNSQYDEEFLTDSVDNFPQLRKLNRLLHGTNGYFAGGCFKNLLTDTKPRDYDVYFFCEEDFNDAIGLFQGLVDMGKAERIYSTKNVIAFKYLECTLEFVDNWHMKPVGLIEQYDFNIDKFAYQPCTGNVWYHKDFFKDLTMKRLSLSSFIPYPLATFDRIIKYGKYGYSPCRETKIAVAKYIAKLEPELINEGSFANYFYEGFD